jgi:hypothetical protein
VDEDHFARVDDSCTFLRGFIEDCGDVTELGLCEGTRAVWCEAGSLVEEDCASEGLACGDDGTGRMRCIGGGCGSLTWEGRCEGTDATWCEDGEVKVRNCADCGQLCGWVEEMGAYYCIDPP